MGFFFLCWLSPSLSCSRLSHHEWVRHVEEHQYCNRQTVGWCLDSLGGDCRLCLEGTAREISSHGYCWLLIIACWRLWTTTARACTWFTRVENCYWFATIIEGASLISSCWLVWSFHWMTMAPTGGSILCHFFYHYFLLLPVPFS